MLNEYKARLRCVITRLCEGSPASPIEYKPLHLESKLLHICLIKPPLLYLHHLLQPNYKYLLFTKEASPLKCPFPTPISHQQSSTHPSVTFSKCPLALPSSESPVIGCTFPAALQCLSSSSPSKQRTSCSHRLHYKDLLILST